MSQAKNKKKEEAVTKTKESQSWIEKVSRKVMN